MIIENTNPYTTETQRLTPAVTSAALGLGLVLIGGALGALTVGWSSLEAALTSLSFYRTIQYWWQLRGWIALAIMCISFAYGSVYYSNRKHTSTRQVRIVLNIWKGYCIRMLIP